MRTGFWVENVRQALDTLASNRLRAALTLLGILIGVAAVIAMVAIGRGVQYYINAQFAAIGTNLIFVIPRAATEADPAGAALRDISSLTMRDVRAIERAVQGRATAVVPVVQRFGPLESEGREAVTVILGTTPGYAPARNWRPLYGSFL
ncbi:MAG: ABC transporter permease, partial [Anaerolineae bacterium]